MMVICRIFSDIITDFLTNLLKDLGINRLNRLIINGTFVHIVDGLVDFWLGYLRSMCLNYKPLLLLSLAAEFQLLKLENMQRFENQG